MSIAAKPLALKRHCKALAKACPHMARALEIGGMPPSRDREGGFRTLMRVIVDQQISVHAGRAIWERLETRLGEVSAERVMAVRRPTLRKCGLSAQKIVYARELAGAIRRGTLDLDGLHDLDDTAAIAQLTAIKGIGAWTAKIYLMFAMGRPDIMPSGDLALQVSAQKLIGLKTRPKPKELAAIAESWRPYRTSAAVLLWSFYRKVPLLDADD